MTKFSMLEELELSEFSGIGGNESIEAIAKSFPRPNHFRLIKSKSSSYPFTVNDNDEEALAISRMHELRSLELYHNRLTNKRTEDDPRQLCPPRFAYHSRVLQCDHGWCPSSQVCQGHDSDTERGRLRIL